MESYSSSIEQQTSLDRPELPGSMEQTNMARSQSAPMLDDDLVFPGHGHQNQQGHNQKPAIPHKAYHFDQNYNPQVSRLPRPSSHNHTSSRQVFYVLQKITKLKSHNTSNQSGDHGPPGPSPLPQHTRVCQPLIEGLGVHQSTWEDVTQRVGEPSVPRLPPPGDVLFPPIPNQPGRPPQPTAAANPIAAFQAGVFEESRLVGELYGARFVPQSP